MSQSTSQQSTHSFFTTQQKQQNKPNNLENSQAIICQINKIYTKIHKYYQKNQCVNAKIQRQQEYVNTQVISLQNIKRSLQYINSALQTIFFINNKCTCISTLGSSNKKQVQQLKYKLSASDKAAKQVQLKMLGTIKRLTSQIQEKNNKINILENLIQQRENQIEYLSNDYSKKQKKLLKMQLQMKYLSERIEKLELELDTERQCNEILSQKIHRKMYNQYKFESNNDKFYDFSQKIQPYFHTEKKQKSQQDVNHHKEILQSQLQNLYTFQGVKKFQSQAPTMTPTIISASVGSLKNSQLFSSQSQSQNSYSKLEEITKIITTSQLIQIGTQYEQTDIQQFFDSQNSSQFTNNKHIQSIERLTNQLGEAYNRINDLMVYEDKNEGQENLNQVGQDNNMIPIKGKQKTKSTYFEKQLT